MGASTGFLEGLFFNFISLHAEAAWCVVLSLVILYDMYDSQQTPCRAPNTQLYKPKWFLYLMGRRNSPVIGHLNNDKIVFGCKSRDRAGPRRRKFFLSDCTSLIRTFKNGLPRCWSAGSMQRFTARSFYVS
ncbi:hypothetical protein NA56DRAFT_430364 [Hyaloscypha hepaticicola]|uniref:Uncharacterized protein n=1 Tax=Hyaloscypha hepaticicola TaxID=2082293 RepID=A0A2J6QGB2_9HELO|nr:hypothetical protein NA56DRAFT_430364 [Hyaloscypha hepaticicola]